MTSKNPLLQKSTLPHQAPMFSRAKVEDFLPAMVEANAEARREFEAIRDNKAAPTFENTVEALEFMGAARSRVMSVLGSVFSSNSNDDIREAESAVQKESVSFYSDIMLDPVIFQRIKKVYDARSTLNLTSTQELLLEETYKGYVRSGALLDDEGKKRLREINERTSELSIAFRNNVIKATADYKKVVDSEEDLAGIPERVKEKYAEKAKAEGMPGKWVITLSPPPVDLFEYADNRALREEIQRAWTMLGEQKPYDNKSIILELVALRDEEAKLLGYKNYAAFVLDERMAKTVDAVNQFLDKNQQVYKPAAEKFLKELTDYATEKDGITKLAPWDVAYYIRRYKEEKFAIDREKLREYFSLEKCVDGLVKHAEKLFGRKMTKTQGKYDTWHPDVDVYEVTDVKTGGFVGLFYADFYVREGAKNGGAWMNSLRQRGRVEGDILSPMVSNTCNYDKPVAGKPVLLSLDDVLTMFHEFGHGNHGLPTTGEYPSQSGTNVKWDFVEVPSQLQENWVLQKEVLDTFAEHYKTGEKLPADMIDKIHAMENFDAAYRGLRQTLLAKIDMAWHTADPSTLTTVEALEDKVIAETWLFPRTAGTTSTSFGHLFAGGYAAGYYGYKWAEVLEADLFETFLKKGLYDKDHAEKITNSIYGAGGTKEPIVLFREVMGRDPDLDAMFRREGLLPPASAPKAPEKSAPPPAP